MEIKKCSICGKELPITDFAFRNKSKGTFRTECKKCHSQYVANQYLERKQLVNKIKSEKGCAKCGEKRSYVLDFHHLDPNEKDYNVARITSNSTKIETIKKEIEKCVVLCANCHREFHYLEEKENLTIEEYLK